MHRQTNLDRKEQQQSPQITTVPIEVHLSRMIVVMMTVIIDSKEQVGQE